MLSVYAHLRNPDTTMSNMHTLGVVNTSGATTASRAQEEPNSASDAETNVDMEIDKIDEVGQIYDDDTLIDYNEDGTAAATEEARRKGLREDFAETGKAYRAFLKSEGVKTLYTSPMTIEIYVS
jgi:hypothetical protein